MQTKRNLLSIGDAAEYLGISIDTLRRWEKRGKIVVLRSPGGHRYFEKEVLDNLFGSKYERDKDRDKKNSEKNNEQNKPPDEKITEEVITEKISDKPKLVVPRYIQTQRISKYDRLLCNTSIPVSPEAPSLSTTNPPINPQNEKRDYSILYPQESRTDSPKPAEKSSFQPEKTKMIQSSKLIIITVSVIITLILIIFLLLNSSPKVLSPIP